MKEKILHSFGLRRGSLGSRFWNFSRPKDSTFNNGFLTAKRMWRHWTHNVDSVEQAGDLIIMEKMYAWMPAPCMHFCRGKEPKSGQELADLADRFFEERGSKPDDARWWMKKAHRSYQSGGSFHSGRTYSDNKQADESPKNSTSSGKLTPPKPQTKPRDPDWEKKVECFNCREKGHIAAKCPNRSANISQVNLTKNLPVTEGIT